MPLDENGMRWACHTCVSGHRARVCAHYDRLMLAVKSNGRPHSGPCTHPDKTRCDCDGPRMVLLVAVPNGEHSPGYQAGSKKAILNM